ncbi:MAG: PKD-like family lipoprotein [Candidatus Pedobacter colombiensis]|uniref:PKD-like family lipoprotein n=1 Tax=Candidatus Pedobacter colombiensis TaxID=3121371 RepID=A0AAJ6B587_9SPHI|nr:PKD-like family lipoprotein [Pedobacter sp.]WEK17524.1 MAG: PKD-like family lipoprotein [Pedobacter sp.]
MKRTVYIASLYLTLLLLFGACSKDKGNYVYTSLDKVTIDVTGLATSYSLLRFDTLRIKPVVKYRGETINPDAPQFKELSFTWEMYPTQISRTIQEKYTIGNTIPLKVALDEKEAVWEVLLTVTNTNTGVKEFAKFTVAITPSLAEGWMVMYEKDGGTDVGMIVNNEISKTNTSERVLYDLYSASNNVPLEGTPGSIISSYASGPATLKIYAQTSADVVSINPTTFQKIDDFSTIFWSKPLVKAPQMIKATEKRKEFVINNNKLHIIDYLILGNGRRAFENPLSGNYGTLAPWVASTTTAFDAVVYDQTNKKFMKVIAGGTEIIPIATTQTPAAIGFDVNNVGMEFEMADLGYSTIANSGWENMIMKDAAGKRFLTIADFKTGEISTIGKEKYDMSNCPEIGAINSITASMSSRVFYYSSPSHVYQFDYTAGLTPVRWNAPGNEKITNIALQKHYNTNAALGVVLYNPKNFCKILYVATYNETTKIGSVYQMEINLTSGVITPGTEKKYTGFGKIKAMAWKPYFIL